MGRVERGCTCRSQRRSIRSLTVRATMRCIEACRTLTVSAVTCVDGNTRIRETCEVGKCFECKAKGRRDGPLSDRQRRACDKLRGHGYSNDPVRDP